MSIVLFSVNLHKSLKLEQLCVLSEMCAYVQLLFWKLTLKNHNDKCEIIKCFLTNSYILLNISI